MKIGVTVKLDQPITAAAQHAKQAEDLGYTSVWLADHYFHRDAATALALMMTSTTDVTLGTAVMSPYLRHPTLLASMAETLREIGPDRFILGIGTGGYEFPSEMAIPLKRPLGVIRDTVAICRGLAEGTAHVQGDAFSAEGSKLRWEPHGGEVYLAARGPKMLELAGSVADGIITHGIAGSHLDFVAEKVKIGADKRSGGRRAKVSLMLDVEINDELEAAQAQLRPRCLTMAAGSYANELIEVYGLDPDEVARARAALRTGDREAAAELVTDSMAQAFGIAGSAGFVADEIRRITDRGADEVIISVGGADFDAMTKQMSQLAEALFS